MTIAPPESGTAIEVPRNRGFSPLGTPQRHYQLDVHVAGPQGGVYTDAVVIEGFGTIYAYAADSAGDIADWLPMAEVSGGDDASVLAVLGCRIAEEPVEAVVIALRGPAA